MRCLAGCAAGGAGPGRAALAHVGFDRFISKVLLCVFLQAALLEERDLGVLLALVTLLLGVVSRSYQGYEALVPRIVRLLARLNPEKERDAQGRSLALDRASVPPEYAYYGIPSPWLQVRA